MKDILIDGLEKEIPEGIELLGEDDLYNVPFELIEVAENINPEDKDYIWANPRRLGKSESTDGNGFDRLSMEELEETIKSDGLLFPIICRWIIKEDGNLAVQVVDGERRYLSVVSLRNKDEMCYSRKTKKPENPKEVYQKLPCRIITGDDKEALKIAFMVSDRAVNWGEGAVAKLIKKLRSTSCTDKEILQLTKKTPGWLREQDRICSLDDLTFSYLVDNKINRALALKLVNIEDIPTRNKKLLATYEDAINIRQETIEHLAESVQKAENKEELAEANLEEKKVLGGDVEDAEAELKKAQARTERRRKKLENVPEPVAKTANLKHIQQDEDEEIDENVETPVEGTITISNSGEIDLPLSLGKIKKHSEQLQVLLDAGGKDAEGKNLMQPKILQVLKSYIDKCIVGGEEDVTKFLKRQRAILMLQNKRESVMAGGEPPDQEEE